tara:strand:+ start:1112 stop:2158 length:1047 start_codon:yes stop_codon:yes gene_type:complete
MTTDSKIEEFINKLKSTKRNDIFLTFSNILNYVEKNCNKKQKKEYIPIIYKESEKNFKDLKIEEFIHILEKIVLIEPNYWKGFYSLGQIHLLNNNIKLANKSFANVISLNPTNKTAIDEFGKTSFILGYTKNGVDAFNTLYGYIKLDTKKDNTKFSDELIKRNEHQDIGIYDIQDNEVFDRMIDYFKSNKDSQIDGISGKGFDKDKKNSTDIVISPKEINSKNNIFKNYFEYLEFLYSDYISDKELINNINVQIGRFNLQKYPLGGHFKNVHCERDSVVNMHRIFAWMTYLNDVDDGGETFFPKQDLKVKPKKGRTLIWPAEWVYPHQGLTVEKGEKYIITGWIEFAM